MKHALSIAELGAGNLSYLVNQGIVMANTNGRLRRLLEDTARVLSSFIDILVVRTNGNFAEMKAFASVASSYLARWFLTSTAIPNSQKPEF